MTRTPGPRPVAVLLLAALLALPAGALGTAGGVADTAAGGPHRIVAATNTTDYLMPPEDEQTRESVRRAAVDVAGAVAGSAERLHGRHRQLTFDEAFADVEGDRRLTLIEARAADIEAHIARLQTAKRDVVRALRDGEVTGDTFLRRLATIQAAARAEAGLIDGIESNVATAADIPPLRVQTRLDSLRVGLLPIEGPVTDAVADAVAARNGALRVYVLAGAESEVFATVENGTYVRESFVGSQYRPGATPQFDIAQALARAQALYTWTNLTAPSSPRARGYGDTAVYRILWTHSQGELRTFIDGATTEVFREIQRKRAPQVPTTATAGAREDGLAVSVNTTGPTGPMHVAVSNTDTGLPADATVRVGGDVVGTTGGDGSLWTVQPTGGFTVNATAGGRTVTVGAP